MDKEFTRYEKLSNKDFDLFLMTYQECLPKNVIDRYFLEGDISFLPLNPIVLAESMRND